MRKIIILTFLLCLITGCAKIKPYEVDVVQGNVLDQTVVERLHVGMNKPQVANLLGTPVLGSTFEDNYWFYAYTNQINGGRIEKKNVALEFKNNKLIAINR